MEKPYLTADDDNNYSAVAEKSGSRLDVFVAELTGCTRSFAQKLIDDGSVTVNEKSVKSGTKIKVGDVIKATLPEPQPVDIKPENIPLDIVYEDEYIAVINKPKGMVVHPAPGNYEGTLVNALMYHVKDLSGIGSEIRPGIVHRIDKMTSGLIVTAKNDFAHMNLSEQIKAHSARRTYICLVCGNIKEDALTIDAPIGRHPTDRKRQAVYKLGMSGLYREAITHITVLERFGQYTLVKAELETGRTHQIRVHMAHIKHPVVGDDVYGSGKNPFGIEGQALHAMYLELNHPKTGERMRFYAPLPEYFLKALTRLDSSVKFSADGIAE